MLGKIGKFGLLTRGEKIYYRLGVLSATKILLTTILPEIILLLDTTPSAINYKLDTIPTKKFSPPPLPDVFKWDSPYLYETCSEPLVHCIRQSIIPSAESQGSLDWLLDPTARALPHQIKP